MVGYLFIYYFFFYFIFFILFAVSAAWRLGEESCAPHRLLYMEEERAISISALAALSPGAPEQRAGLGRHQQHGRACVFSQVHQQHRTRVHWVSRGALVHALPSQEAKVFQNHFMILPSSLCACNLQVAPKATL